MKAPIGSIGLGMENHCMNYIKVSYKGHIISIAHHHSTQITTIREVAIIYPDDEIEIVDTFYDSVESLEEAIAEAKAIIDRISPWRNINNDDDEKGK